MIKTEYIYANTNVAAPNKKELSQWKGSGKIIREFNSTAFPAAKITGGVI
jgi:hypothetical protein